MFKFLLSPQAQAELDFKRAEFARLNALSNEALANELLTLAERALLLNPEVLQLTGTYDNSLISDLIPELGRRLGATLVSKLPGHPDKVRRLSMRALRSQLGSAVAHASRNRTGVEWSLLTGEGCNGNPVLFAMDRLCPADLNDPDDMAALSISSIQQVRGVPVTGMWVPSDNKWGEQDAPSPDHSATADIEEEPPRERA